MVGGEEVRKTRTRSYTRSRAGTPETCDQRFNRHNHESTTRVDSRVRDTARRGASVMASGGIDAPFAGSTIILTQRMPFSSNVADVVRSSGPRPRLLWYSSPYVLLDHSYGRDLSGRRVASPAGR